MKIHFLILAASMGCIGAAQTFPVAGTVVDAGSNAPMRRVRIALAPSDHRTQQVAIITGEDGTFSFNARQGKYVLTAERAGMRQSFGLSSAGLGFGSLIITGADQDTAHLVFRWFSPGAISGIIVDDRGEPAESALVQLIRSSVAGGRRRFATFAWTRTDDRGYYRFGSLAPGTYYLAVTGEPWYAARMNRPVPVSNPADQAAPLPASEPTSAYAPIYYPNATDSRAASAVVLHPATEIQANFTLLTITGVNVHVNCANAGGRNGMLSLLADGIEGVEGFQRQLNFFGASQTIVGVPPGRYVVRIAGSGESPFAVRKTIDVGATDVSVDLALQPAPTVSGKVVFKNPDTRPRATMYIRLVNEATGTAVARAIEPDGGFSFSNIAVARFRPVLSGTDGFFASKISPEGATLKDGVLDITDGATVKLNVLASNEIGVVKGLVLRDDKPIPAMLVVLAPRAGTDPYEYRGFQTDSDGSFDFQNVRAGDYVLFAVDRLDLEYTNADAVRPYFGSAKPIRIETHGVYTERLALSPLPAEK